MESQSEFEVLFHESMSNVDMTAGSIVTATVIEIRNDYVVINAGLKSEGIIPKNQFLNLKGELEISLGDVVEVTLDMIEKALWHLQHYPVTTVFTDMPKDKQNDPNSVKMVRGADQALWFGRGMTGYGDWHLGIYGYNRNALEMYPGLTSTREERIEELEQLRWLKNGWDIGVFPCEFNGVEINTPEDVKKWNEK